MNCRGESSDKKLPSPVRRHVLGLLVGLGVSCFVPTAEAAKHKDGARHRIRAVVDSLPRIARVDRETIALLRRTHVNDLAAIETMGLRSFENLAEVDRAVEVGELRLVTDTPYYFISRELGKLDPDRSEGGRRPPDPRNLYASLLPHAFESLNELATDFYREFGVSLRLTSMLRTMWYTTKRLLRSKNGNAEKISSHPCGATIDIGYLDENGRPIPVAQKAWLANRLAALTQAGKVVAAFETEQKCFHVTFLKPSEVQLAQG